VKKRAENSHICIISQHDQIRTKGEFEILINNGNGTKVEWHNWEKLLPFTNIDGAIATINGGSRVCTLTYKIVSK
jgi:hypothetical protein